MPVIPVLGQMSQEDHEFENSLGCIMRPCLEKFSAEVFAASIKYDSKNIWTRKGARRAKQFEAKHDLRTQVVVSRSVIKLQWLGHALAVAWRHRWVWQQRWRSNP